MKYGYARVSPGGKSESVEAQARQLTKAGCRKVFRDVHVSGAKADRAPLRRVIDQAQGRRRADGDAARPAGAIDTRPVEHARGDRRSQSRVPIADRHLGRHHHVARPADVDRLGGLAEFERDLIRARTGEGRARAVARGVKMGRPPKLTPHQQKEAIKRRDQGEETLADIGRSYNVSAATISRLIPDPAE